MLLWVLRALAESPSIGRIAVSLDDPGGLESLPDLGVTDVKDKIIAAPTGESPGDSVLRTLETLDDPWPVLVTTADHPLLSAEMVEHFCAAAPEDADVAVAVAPASLIRRAYPGAVRTYYRFAGGAYSGCNLYCLRTPAARQAVAFWVAGREVPETSLAARLGHWTGHPVPVSARPLEPGGGDGGTFGAGWGNRAGGGVAVRRSGDRCRQARGPRPCGLDSQAPLIKDRVGKAGRHAQLSAGSSILVQTSVFPRSGIPR